MTKIYTKGGDNGTTSLCRGVRIRKDDVHIEVCGALDELNAHIGLLVSLLLDGRINQMSEDSCGKITSFLRQLQSVLFVIGGFVASGRVQPADLSAVAYRTKEIEDFIDLVELNLPPQHCFVLPGGVLVAAQSHICRTVCRRLERRMRTLSECVAIPDEMQAFINRLSDYFFILSRYLNIHGGNDEKTWGNTCR